MKAMSREDILHIKNFCEKKMTSDADFNSVNTSPKEGQDHRDIGVFSPLHFLKVISNQIEFSNLRHRLMMQLKEVESDKKSNQLSKQVFKRDRSLG